MEFISSSISLTILGVSLLFTLSSAQGFTFFYFIQQWPGSSCVTHRSCCYPKTGKSAADFIIHGLRPYNLDGSYSSNCDSNSPFDPSKIADLSVKMQKDWPSLSCPLINELHLWAQEWKKYGTCSKSLLGQHAYFQAALNLKKKVNLLQLLQNAGIKADGGFYSLTDINDAIRGATGYEAGVMCNTDKLGNAQLNQIYVCADPLGSKIVDCPGLPPGKCSQKIKFPSF